MKKQNVRRLDIQGVSSPKLQSDEAPQHAATTSLDSPSKISPDFLLVLRSHLRRLDLDATVIDRVTTCFKASCYRKQERFARAGEVVNKLGFVAEGLFCMEVPLEDGARFIKDFMGEGQFLLANFNPEAESLVDIHALKPAIVLEARYSEIQHLCRCYPELDRLAREGTQRRLETLGERLRSFATMNAGMRYHIFQQHYGPIEQEIPQYLIAAYLGVTPTQLSRIRKRSTSMPST